MCDKAVAVASEFAFDVSSSAQGRGWTIGQGDQDSLSIQEEVNTEGR
jgi:hypothetical protein